MHNFKRLLKVIILLLIVNPCLFAQEYKPSIPTPNAYSFIKFSQVPVNLHTGVPDITIPVYSIKDGVAEIPISLRYHAGGIKVLEEASWVGLGWNLNVGGCITQVINGKDDFVANYHLGFYNQSNQTNIRLIETGTSESSNKYIFEDLSGSGPCTPSDKPACELVAPTVEGYYMPDNFRFQFLNYSGTFYIDLKTQLPIIIDNKDNLKIEIIYPDPKFIITDSYGVKYYFDVMQSTVTNEFGTNTTSRTFYLSSIKYLNGQTASFTYKDELPVVDNIPYMSYRISSLVPSDNTKHLTSYYNPVRLKEINTSNFKITFNVSTSARLDLPNDFILDNIIINDKNTNKTKKFVLGTSYFESNTNKEMGYNSSYHWTQNNQDRYLKRLKLDWFKEDDNKPYVFTYNSTTLPIKSSFATDYWGFYNGRDNKTPYPNLAILTYGDQVYSKETIDILNSLNLPKGGDRGADESSCQAAILKQITYPTGGYSIFNYELNTFGNYFYLPKGELDKLNELQNNALIDMCAKSGGVTDPKFSSESFTLTSESRIKINAIISTSTINNDFNNIRDAYIKMISSTGTEIFKFVLNENSNLNGMNIKSSDLTLPVGTYTVSCYIPRIGTNPIYSTAECKITKFVSVSDVLEKPKWGVGSGLRIKSIELYDNFTNKSNKTYYYYENNNVSNGILMSGLKYYNLNLKSEYVRDYDEYVLTANSNTSLSFDGQGANVGYSNVKQVNSDGSYIKSDFFCNEEVSFSNSSIQCKMEEINVPNQPVPKNGKLLHQYFYQSDNTLVKSVDYFYDVISANNIAGITGLYSEIKLSCQDNGPNCTYRNTHFIYYAIPVFNVRTKSIVEKIDNVKKFTSYKYNNFNQIAEVKLQSNDPSESFITKYKYPLDFSPNSTEPLYSMINKNIISPIIEELKLKNSSLTSATYYEYNFFGSDNIPKLNNIYKIESETPLSENFNGLNTYGKLSTSSIYQLKTTIQYNNSLNVNLIQNSNDIPTTYIWGYNNTLPIAEVKNAGSNQVLYEGFESENTSFDSRYRIREAKTGHYSFGYPYTVVLPSAGAYILTYWMKVGTGAWQFIRDQIFANKIIGSNNTATYIDDVRLYPSFPYNTTMTTYTYDPLFGITSKTDENNVTTYYEYDSFGRLKYIKDMDGNILKEYNYHYQGQPQN